MRRRRLRVVQTVLVHVLEVDDVQMADDEHFYATFAIAKGLIDFVVRSLIVHPPAITTPRSTCDEKETSELDGELSESLYHT